MTMGEAGRKATARRGGAAYTITGECERLFCETLKAVFLGEGKADLKDSLVMGVHKNRDRNVKNDIRVDLNDSTRRLPGLHKDGTIPPAYAAPAPDGFFDGRGLVVEWVEVWDYVGGARFRGFVVEKDDEKSLFVFFDDGVVGKELKHGLMALLELCSPSALNCSNLVVALDRYAEASQSKGIVRDLGWVGFEFVTLDKWLDDGKGAISDKWLFMGMEV